MSDRSAATIIPFRTGGHEEAVADVLHEYGFDTDEACALPTSEPMPFFDGVEFMTEGVHLGILDDIGPRLEALDVAYVGCQSARYEFPAVVRWFHPELGIFESDADDVSNVFVRAAAIESAVQGRGDRADGIIENLWALTGRRWSDRFTMLRRRTAALRYIAWSVRPEVVLPLPPESAPFLLLERCQRTMTRRLRARSTLPSAVPSPLDLARYDAWSVEAIYNVDVSAPYSVSLTAT